MRSAFVIILSLVLLMTGCKPSAHNHTLSVLPSLTGTQAASSTQSSNQTEVVHITESLDDTFQDAWLLYDGMKLTLKVHDGIIPVPSQFLDISGALLQPHVEPRVTLLKVNGTDDNLFLVTINWPTNKIGSTIEMWLYDYHNGKLTLQWNLADEMPEVKSTLIDTRTLSVKIPYYGLDQKIPVTGDDAKRLDLDQSGTDLASYSDIVQLGTPTQYLIRDFDGDSQDEIAVNRLMYLESAPFVLTRLYAIYRIKDSRLIPVTSFFSSNPNEALADIRIKG